MGSAIHRLRDGCLTPFNPHSSVRNRRGARYVTVAIAASRVTKARAPYLIPDVWPSQTYALRFVSNTARKVQLTTESQG